MKFEKPFVEIIKFESEDVIATSGFSTGRDAAISACETVSFKGQSNNFTCGVFGDGTVPYEYGGYTFTPVGNSGKWKYNE